MASRLERVKSLKDLLDLWKAGLLMNAYKEPWRPYHSSGYEGKCLGDYWKDRKDCWRLHADKAFILVEYDEEEVLPSKAQASHSELCHSLREQ